MPVTNSYPSYLEFCARLGVKPMPQLEWELHSDYKAMPSGLVPKACRG
jgi:hypothetical protein